MQREEFEALLGDIEIDLPSGPKGPSVKNMIIHPTGPVVESWSTCSRKGPKHTYPC